MINEYVAINIISNPLSYGPTFMISISYFEKCRKELVGYGYEYNHILSIPIYGCRGETIDPFFIIHFLNRLIEDDDYNLVNEEEKEKLRCYLDKIFSNGRLMFNNDKYRVNQIRPHKNIIWNSVPYTFCIENPQKTKE